LRPDREVISVSPQPKTKRTGLHTVAPLVPLGIALLHGALNPATAPKTPHAADRAHELAADAGSAVTHHCQNITNAKDCHTTFPEGCTNATTSNTYDAYLSFLKNLFPPADALPVATLSSLHDFQNFDQKTIAMELGKQKQEPFADQLADIGQGNIYQAVGYLYYAIPGGIETCNCKLKSPDDKDIHLGVGFDSEMAKSIANGDIKNRGTEADPAVQQTSIIVEMTPFFRETFHPDWTLKKVQSAEGHQIKVVGQLIVDNEHNEEDQNCAFPNAGEECWRGSAWELHPVTSFFVCSTTQACTADSSAWVALDAWKP
jgi:hypothetical protein